MNIIDVAKVCHEANRALCAGLGWKYGAVKDADKKEHPCFVPYEELPKEQQAKDHLFKATVSALSPLLG